MVETRTGGGASRRELAASGERGHAAGVTARKLCISSLALLSLAACGGGSGASGGSGKLPTAIGKRALTKLSSHIAYASV